MVEYIEALRCAFTSARDPDGRRSFAGGTWGAINDAMDSGVSRANVRATGFVSLGCSELNPRVDSGWSAKRPADAIGKFQPQQEGAKTAVVRM